VKTFELKEDKEKELEDCLALMAGIKHENLEEVHLDDDKPKQLRLVTG
jgi:hypothetical protein